MNEKQQGVTILILILLALTLMPSLACSQSEGSTSSSVYEDSVLRFELENYSTLIIKYNQSRDWRSVDPDPFSYPAVFIHVSFGSPDYYHSFNVRKWEKVELLGENRFTARYKLSTTLSGTQGGTIDYSETWIFNKDSGLIARERDALLSNGWGAFSTINGLLVGGDRENDFAASNEFDETPIEYETTMIFEYPNERRVTEMIGYKGYHFAAVYDKQVKQGFAVLQKAEYSRDIFTDLNYGCLQVQFRHPLQWWEGYLWALRLNFDSSKTTKDYMYFYRFTDDPVSPVKEIIDGMTMRPSIELTGEFDYLLMEKTKIRLAAMVTDADTLEPISEANVVLEVYDPNGNLWVSEVMTEKISASGVYEWESKGTIMNLRLNKGVYLACARVISPGFTTARAADAIEFHIDPPQEEPTSQTMLYFLTALIVPIAATTGGIALLRRRITKRTSPQL